MKSIKGFALTMVSMVSLAAFNPAAEAANFHSITSAIGQVVQQTTPQQQRTSTVPHVENVESGSVPSAVQMAGIRKVTQDTVSDFVWGAKADYNVVGNLRRPEANVMTINPYTGVVCQYTIDTEADFKQFMMEYVRDGHILVMDTQKAIRGFRGAARAIRSDFYARGINGDMLSVTTLGIEDLEEDEIAMCKGFLTGSQFIVAEIHKDYQLVAQAPVVVNNNNNGNGRSGLSNTLEDINNVMSTANLIRNWNK